MANPVQQTLDEIFSLYEKHGTDDYIGEQISQIEHMCQAAQQAERAGYDTEVILAAFFHDIGHLLPSALPENDMDGYGSKDHEQAGADYLRKKGFPEKVATLVESHVAAKRYLAWKNQDYEKTLSEASRKTLAFQGGKMSREEAEQFERNPLFDLIIRLRHWDEAAKREHVPLPPLQHFRSMAEALLSRPKIG